MRVTLFRTTESESEIRKKFRKVETIKLRIKIIQGLSLLKKPVFSNSTIVRNACESQRKKIKRFIKMCK
jgi:hypothetical protein